jgi:hypothetical protein
MDFWLLFPLVILSICCLIFFTKVYIDVKYKRNSEDDYISINIYMIRKFVAYSMEIPIVAIAISDDSLGIESTINAPQDEDGPQTGSGFYILNLRFFIRKIIFLTRLYYQTIDNIFKSLVCEKLYWKTIYGSEDAAITGIMTGTLWTIKALVVKKLENRISYLGQPVITVMPIFGCDRFDVDFECIFSIKLGNLIKAFGNIYNIKK